MTTESSPNAERAPPLRIVGPTDTAASWSDWTGRVGALSALARLPTSRREVRLLSYVVLGASVGVAVLVAAATLPVLFGYHTYNIRGGSMGASLPRGSVAISKPTSPWALKVGDIVALRSSTDGAPTLHRIVEIKSVDGQRRFVTQGDANPTPDPQPVTLEGPGDRVVYSVPYAGYILSFAGSGMGRAVLIGAPLALLAALFLRDKWQGAREKGGAEAGTSASAAGSAGPSLRLVTPPQLGEENNDDLPAFLIQQLRRRGGYAATEDATGAASRQETDAEGQQESRRVA